MKTLTTTFFGLLLMSTPMFSTQLSEYCDKPTGHLNDPEFGDVNGRILLSISKINDNSIAVTVKPLSEEAKKIDFLQVNVKGLLPVIIGEDEGDVLDEYKAVVTFENDVPEIVEISEILWSNPDWIGRWEIKGLTVPFDASCDVESNDDVAPIMTDAKFIESFYNSVKLELKATDKDNDNQSLNVNTYIINDEGNNIINKVVKTDDANICIVPDLKVNTNYNFTITAKDNSNNISTNNIKITASTLSMPEVYIIDNFEGETNPWEAVEGGHGVSVVSNPLTGGINSSSYVLKGGRDAVANNWAATMLRNLSIPGGVYQYLHIMMLRDVIGTVPNVKLSDAAGGDISPLDGQIMKTGEWQDIVYDISAIGEGRTIDFVYYMYDRGELPSNQTAYLDDIVLNNIADARSTTTLLLKDLNNGQNVYATKGNLNIKGFMNASLKVYSIAGRLEIQKIIDSDEVSVKLNKGLYIVDIDGLKFKMIIE